MPLHANPIRMSISSSYSPAFVYVRASMRVLPCVCACIPPHVCTVYALVTCQFTYLVTRLDLSESRSHIFNRRVKIPLSSQPGACIALTFQTIYTQFHKCLFSLSIPWSRKSIRSHAGMWSGGLASLHETPAIANSILIIRYSRLTANTLHAAMFQDVQFL